MSLEENHLHEYVKRKILMDSHKMPVSTLNHTHMERCAF